MVSNREAHDHLEHLRTLGEVMMEEEKEVLYYKIAKI